MATIAPLKDSHGRNVHYLRISITDRCNLRCSYCATDPNFTFIPHDKILTYEEILTIVDAAIHVGIDKVRLTGGEPFARKGFIDLLKRMRERHPTLDIRITTNATLIEPYIQQLVAINVNALNISFDTFNPQTFYRITGQNLFKKAYQGLIAAIDSPLTVKLNSVALKNINDRELGSFINFAREHDVDVRFIELMPLGGRGGWDENSLWTAEDILNEAQKYCAFIPAKDVVAKRDDHGPAILYDLDGGRGRIGIISPLSNHFCDHCNRLRITSDGRLRTCLFSDEEFPLRELLQQPKVTRDDIISFFHEKLKTKPIGAKLLAKNKKYNQIIQRGMSTIGG